MEQGSQSKLSTKQLGILATVVAAGGGLGVTGTTHFQKSELTAIKDKLEREHDTLISLKAQLSHDHADLGKIQTKLKEIDSNVLVLRLKQQELSVGIKIMDKDLRRVDETLKDFKQALQDVKKEKS